jgi:hypothetical protein
MTKEKQIEEMAKIIGIPCYKRIAEYGDGSQECPSPLPCNECTAELLYNASYRKQIDGEWVKEWNHMECSNCHYRAPYKKIKAGYHLQDLTAYCPNCGAKMGGGAE